MSSVLCSQGVFSPLPWPSPAPYSPCSVPSKGLYASPAASKILYLFRWEEEGEGEREGEGEEEEEEERVHFAEDVVDPSGDSEEFRRQHSRNSSFSVRKSSDKVKGMPANRVALYKGSSKSVWFIAWLIPIDSISLYNLESLSFSFSSVQILPNFPLFSHFCGFQTL
ncbi:hypothetical protein CK203_013210 [Vitis vinifera]|uniref:Uncharacterized protein n=1 Tax=Vitis vinifera TaxID=29760 RepID=A0A438JQ41_VITVI|nr:hypothetical protein CK203_013210 [Vitis vinifera]